MAQLIFPDIWDIPPQQFGGQLTHYSQGPDEDGNSL